MGKGKRKRLMKQTNEIRDYMLSCEACPLLKKKNRLDQKIVHQVMLKLGQADDPEPKPEYWCPVRKCIVDIHKPRSCAPRDAYYEKVQQVARSS